MVAFLDFVHFLNELVRKKHFLQAVMAKLMKQKLLNISDTGEVIEEKINPPLVQVQNNIFVLTSTRHDPLGGRPFYYRGLVHGIIATFINLCKYRSFRHPLDNRQGD